LAPFQLFYLLLSLGVFAWAWLRGGHTERTGVAVFVLAFLSSFMLQTLTMKHFRLGEAIVDLALFAAMVWLALRRDRWWTLAAAAFSGLTLIAHAVMFLTPDLQEQHIRMDVASRWGIGVLLILCLGAGVIERWMAGERPVSTEARWRRPQRSAT
jgi:peptidoglycan/LPS O-acetylase OafA/YrhL